MEINPDHLLDKIREAKNGSQSAFNYLLDKYWNDVYGFQLKKTKNEYESEDITIQTFSKAFNKIESFDENYSFTTWLIAISKNIHIDQVRKKNASIRSRTSMQDEERVYEIADETPGIEDKLIKEQNLEQLLADIKQLKPHYQQVINLRFFQEKSYKEIAAILDEPMNNIKVKLLRAKKLLAEIIELRKS
ncbi:RNA polymerase sigma-70 factor (ECF subfamily) [Christiangramia gaetbulicola]|uniref:RNA polymerase sigma-70 factor (ECF subfamily) n=1 Tax=Christiangramia gaetbulicola TaxID=703340 RepID=A0A2T6AE63_9FLAO|nr:sigma-70 family RNA polymerase sigma factor [Christiangramia gaetbulicola]PTX42108.1 RNA polymerase sigma-70 factor (ECF subfamily) [Christiangramia gaetbulicola]